MKKLLLSDILTRQVTTVSPHSKLDEALKIMHQQKISAIIVTDDDKPVGIFTERDALKVIDQHIDSTLVTIESLMSTPVLSLYESMEYREAYYLIAERGIRHLAVTNDEGNLVGIVTEGDFLRNLGMEFLVQIKEVGALMSKDISTLPADATLDEAVALMRERRSPAVIVEDQKRPIGIITERDIVKFALRETSSSPVLSEVMISPVTTVKYNTPIVDAMKIMDTHGFRRLIVVDDEGFTLGILSRHEIVSQLYNRHVELLEMSLEENKNKLKKVEKELHIEQSLHKLESRLSESQKIARIGSWEHNHVSDALWASAETYKIFGLSPDENLTIATIVECVIPEEREWVVETYMDAVQNNKPYDITFHISCVHGKIKSVHERCITEYDKEGNPLISIGTIQDVTELYHKEEEVVRYHAMLMALVKGSTDSIFIKDKEGKYIVGNDALASLLNCSLDAIIGADDYALFPSELAEQFRADDERIIQNKKAETYEELVASGDKLLPYQTTKGPLFINGKVEGVFGVARDIGSLKKTEYQLKENEDRLNQLLNTLPYGVQENNMEGVITYSNPAHHHILGVNEGTLLGHHIWDFMQHDEDKEDLRDYLTYLVAEQPTPKPYISNILTKDGRKVELEITWDYQRDNSGKVVGFISVLSDITEKKLAEENYRILFERTGTSMGIVENDGTFSLVNRTSAELLGTTPDAMIGKPFTDFLHPDDVERIVMYHAARVHGEEVPEQYEYKFITVNGEIGVGLMTAVYLPEIKKTLVSVIDITERKLSEEALKESESRFQAMFHTTVDGLLIADVEDKKFVKVNASFCKIFGYTEEEALELSVTDLHPKEALPHVLDQFEKQLSGEIKTAEEIPVLRKDKSIVYADVTSSPFTQNNRTYMAGFFRDISERRKSQKEKREHTWFLESLDRVSKTLAGYHGSTKLLQSLTEILLDIFDVDRAWFLYPCNPEAPDYSVLSESTRDGFEGAYEKNLKMPMDDLSAGVFGYALEMGSPVVDQADEHEDVPDFVREFKIQSQMAMALRPELGDAWLMGLHQCSKKRIWTEMEKRLFQVISERISLALSGTILLEQIKENRELLLQAEQTAQLGHWELDITTGKAQWSEEIHRIADIDPSQEVGPAFLSSIVHQDDWQRVEASLMNAAKKGILHEMEYRIYRPSGEERWLYCKAVRQNGNDGTPKKLVGIAQDITERKNKEQSLRLSAAVFENTGEGVMITDADVNIISVNPAFTDITGYSEEEVKGKNPRFLQSNKQERTFYTQMWHTLHTAGKWQGEIWNRRKNGEIYPEWLSLGMVKDEKGKIINYIGLFSDITQTKKSETEFRFLATHDPLTKLPNRMLLNEQLDFALKRMQRHDEYIAVLYIDIDRFKEVNDSLGHPAGDRLLVIMAERFREVLREEDFVARASGDEFVIILEEVKSENDVGKVAKAILNRIKQPMLIDGHQVTVTSSIGIAIGPTDGESSIILLKNADSALYRAKEQGRNTYSFYSKELAEKNFEKMYLHNALYNALEQEEFVVHYQPQVNMSTGEVIGTEALVRWKSPEMGLVSPGRFIPVAEETGLIITLGEWVLRQACIQMVQWKSAGFPMQRVAVNLSGRQLVQENIIDTIQNVINDTGINPADLELEITESTVIQNEGNIDKLNKLKALGIHLSIDDFGTGYSSLSRLSNMPIDKLKIDYSFVTNILNEDENVKITDVIIQLSKSLSIDVIAEGVETKMQGDYLMKKGCMHAQGYFYSRPLPAKEFEVWLRGQMESRVK